MKRTVQITLLLLGIVVAAFAPGTTATAQIQDSVEVIETVGSGPYQCCYAFNVLSRRRRTEKISEFHVRILSGRGSFIAGSAASPRDWTVFVAADLKSVAWFASTTAAEIDSGQTKSGFLICANDTGVVRFVLETRNLDTLYSRDTIAVACRGIDCDEAFFRRVPSNEVCLYDVDLVGGNRRDLFVNDFRLRVLTPGVSFSTATFAQPSGWVRSRISADSMQFFTTTRPVRFGQFVEGFRFQALNVTDTFRVLYRTFNNGDLLCSDTATLVCTRLDAIDSLRIRSRPNCCNDLTLKNSHRPGSPLDRFVLRVSTPGVRISSAPLAPSGWTRGALPAAGDSVFYTRATPLASGDTALFSGLCFDNALAASDTIRYSWTTYSSGIPVTRTSETQLCQRPLTRCDTARVLVDSTEGAPSRCIRMTVTNRNSRDETITRVVARVSNPGTVRRILTATAPAGWLVESIGRDSVVFGGGELEAGTELTFDLCLSTGDSTMRDPVALTWRTESLRGVLCTGTINFNANIVRSSDTANVAEISSQNADYCCYSIAFLNRNDARRRLTGFQLEVASTNVLFADAVASGGWSVVSPGFPSPQIGYTGDTVESGASTPLFTFCIDARNIAGRPATIPIIWRSFSGSTLVTTERLDLRCVGPVDQQCDTAALISSTLGETNCTFAFGIANLHAPASSITKVQFVLTSADGTFSNASVSGDATRWTQITVRPDSIVFRGDSILSRTTVSSFNLEVEQTDGVPTTFEVTTFNGDQSICRDVVATSCASAGIAIPTTPSGFRLGNAAPNPFSGQTTIEYELLRPASVSLTIRDDNGKIVRQLNGGAKEIGDHTFTLDADDLPSGMYLYTLEAGGERWTKRLVLVR